MKFRKPRVTGILLMLLGLLMIAAGCGDDAAQNQSSGSSQAPVQQETAEPAAQNVPDPDASHPIVTIEMDSGQTIKAELYPEVAPNTVNNFISLVDQGFYDGLTFHRLISGFMIQGGDPNGNGTGGPGYKIAGEFTQNGYQNDLLHTRGVLSMARRGDSMDSAGSQFFIMHADAPSLDGLYASFGKVIEGMEVVDEIASLPVLDDNGTAEDPPIIKKVTVDTLGKEYAEPEKM